MVERLVDFAFLEMWHRAFFTDESPEANDLALKFAKLS